MKPPWSDICRYEDGMIDYNEIHAILVGIGDALRPCSDARAWELHCNNWHYYTVARGVTTILLIVGLILLVKGVF